MEDRLKYILAFVNDWLKFAETKNAALLAADTALVLALLKMLQSNVFSNQIASLYVTYSIPVLAIAAIVCLISLIPQTTIPWLATTRRPNETDNLLFYGDIAKYDSKRYIESLYKQAVKDLTEINKYEEDLAEQIIVNSCIALRKYRLFNLALWMNVIVGITPVGAILLMVAIKIARG